MKLRVAINATPLLAPLTGIGNYIVHLGEALAATGEVDPFCFYGMSLRHEVPAAQPSPGKGPWRPPKGVLDVLRRVPFQRELRAWPQRVAFARAWRKHGISLYHEPNYVPVRYDVPFVVTVHDLSWRHYPQMHPVERVRWLERGLPRALAGAGAILVDSAFVRDEVVSTFGIARARVHLAALGVAPEFRPRAAADTEAVLRRHDLQHARYVLTVGTIEPRKNLRHALAAYGRLEPTLRARFPLVIAGARGWHATELERDLQALASRGQVRLLGHVSAAELPLLYAGAALFVFPSLYEGFGLPVLEAMASGVAPLASNRSSLPEVVADCGMLFDPEDIEATTAVLARGLEDEAWRSQHGLAARERAASFTWARCAQATLIAYRAALAPDGVPR